MQLVFVTNNKNKLKEVKTMLPGHIKLLSLSDINVNENIPETTGTIEGNAIQKASYIKVHYGYDCFADDTGLEVQALDGAPGVESARYAGSQRSSEDNMQKLLNALKNKSNRTAQFKTVIALVVHNDVHTFTGLCEGEITAKKIGKGGFGYDPIFKPNMHHQTFAEMDMALKNNIGHRGKAMEKLISYLKK